MSSNMDDEADRIANTPWKSLKRIPDVYLRRADREEDGRVYSAILTELQIRPESHEAFFEGNLRPFRNKKDISTLIAKADDDSLLKVSKIYLTAYGNLGWDKERKWLLRIDELKEDEQPLQYIPPRERKEGDYDRFYQILAKLWKQMRSVIFELKPSAQRNYNLGGPLNTPNSMTTNDLRRRMSHPCTPVATPSRHTRQGTAYGQGTQSPEPDLSARTEISYDWDAQSPKRWFDDAPPANEVTVPGFWHTSKTERVILNAITKLIEAQHESHPKVFATLWHRHVARLEEVEQFEEQQSVMAGGHQDTVDLDQQDNTATIQTEATTESVHYRKNDTDVTMTILKSGESAERTITDADHQHITLSAPLTTTSTFKGATTDRGTNTESNVSLSDQHRPSMPPHFPLTSYLPPTPPNRMTVYITPYTHTAMHFAQPYIWPDAPVHPTSFTTFRNGIRVRANVPGSIVNEKMSLVLGYGWNDFCCVVTGEDTWKNWFMKDLRWAAERGGVGVWRMRVCVVAVA